MSTAGHVVSAYAERLLEQVVTNWNVEELARFAPSAELYLKAPNRSPRVARRESASPLPGRAVRRVERAREESWCVRAQRGQRIVEEDSRRRRDRTIAVHP
ncbi:MAG: hypothetical protein ACREMY_07425, partial [bacterium]